MMFRVKDAGPDVRDWLARAAGATRTVVVGVRADQLDDPTPCSEFAVRDLLAHLVEAIVSLGAIGLEESPEADTRVADPSQLGVSPDDDIASVVEAYDGAVASTIAIWWADGAMKREYAAPWGRSSAEQLLGFLVIEVLVHGWDLAAATGRPPPSDTGLAEIVYEWAVRTIDDRARIPGVYGAEVAVAHDAAAIDRLAGFLGRSPRWAVEDR